MSTDYDYDSAKAGDVDAPTGAMPNPRCRSANRIVNGGGYCSRPPHSEGQHVGVFVNGRVYATWSESAAIDVPRHDPTYLAHHRARWCKCSCGWQSGEGSSTFVQLKFGQHLVDVSSTASERMDV